MIIEGVPKSLITAFQDLKVGDTFLYEDRLLMKIDNCRSILYCDLNKCGYEDSYNCVSLASGIFYRVIPSERVEIVTVKCKCFYYKDDE